MMRSWRQPKPGPPTTQGSPFSGDIRRTRHIGDFCGWKNHDSYRTAFERLLRDLKATAAPANK
jgi:hypothetical protein